MNRTAVEECTRMAEDTKAHREDIQKLILHVRDQRRSILSGIVAKKGKLIIGVREMVKIRGCNELIELRPTQYPLC